MPQALHRDYADMAAVIFLEDGNLDFLTSTGEIERRVYASGSAVYFSGSVFHRGAGFNATQPKSKRVYMYIDCTRVGTGISTEYLYIDKPPAGYSLMVDEVCDSVWEALVKCYSTRFE